MRENERIEPKWTSKERRRGKKRRKKFTGQIKKGETKREKGKRK